LTDARVARRNAHFFVGRAPVRAQEVLSIDILQPTSRFDLPPMSRGDVPSA